MTMRSGAVFEDACFPSRVGMLPITFVSQVRYHLFGSGRVDLDQHLLSEYS